MNFRASNDTAFITCKNPSDVMFADSAFCKLTNVVYAIVHCFKTSNSWHVFWKSHLLPRQYIYRLLHSMVPSENPCFYAGFSTLLSASNPELFFENCYSYPHFFKTSLSRYCSPKNTVLSNLSFQTTFSSNTTSLIVINTCWETSIKQDELFYIHTLFYLLQGLIW